MRLLVWGVVVALAYYALVELPSPTFEVHGQGEV